MIVAYFPSTLHINHQAGGQVKHGTLMALGKLSVEMISDQNLMLPSTGEYANLGQPNGLPSSPLPESVQRLLLILSALLLGRLSL